MTDSLESARLSRKEREDLILQIQTHEGVDVFTARLRVDDEYAQYTLNKKLGSGWQSKLTPEAADRMIDGLARTYSIGSSTPNLGEGQTLIHDTKKIIVKLGRAGKLVQLCDYLTASREQKEKILLASEAAPLSSQMAHSVEHTFNEKAAPVKVVLDGAAAYASKVDSHLPQFQSGWANSACRIAAGVAVGSILVCVGVALAPLVAPIAAPFAVIGAKAAAIAAHHASGLKISSVLGGAALSLCKEYYDEPKDLADYVKNKAKYSEIATMNNAQTKVCEARVDEMMSKQNLSLAEQTALKKQIRKQCGENSIAEVKSVLGTFYSASSRNEDISEQDRWAMRSLLKYQRFDQLRKLADQVEENKKTMDIKQAFEHAIEKRMEDPEFKSVADNRKIQLARNLGKVSLAAGIKLGIGNVLGGHEGAVIEAVSGFGHRVVDKVKEQVSATVAELVGNSAAAGASGFIGAKLMNFRTRTSSDAGPPMVASKPASL